MKETWYRNGLRFSCQQCGECCWDEGDYTEVYVEPEDIERMAAHLEIYPHEFRKRYVKKSDGFLVLRSRGGSCIMLSRGRCRAHPEHPRQCRTWPFWPQNLYRHVWYGEVKKRCPGVGKGRRHTEEEIERVMISHSLVS
jgi:Fe-S-cluster containining protein